MRRRRNGAGDSAPGAGGKRRSRVRHLAGSHRGRDAAAEVVDIPTPDPDAPGAFRYAVADQLVGLLGRAGFAELEVRDWRGVLPLGGGLAPTEAATFALATFASFGELLAKAGDQALTQARQSLTARFAGHQQEGVVRMDARVHIFTGARPG
jgi:hypothetical protein